MRNLASAIVLASLLGATGITASLLVLTGSARRAAGGRPRPRMATAPRNFQRRRDSRHSSCSWRAHSRRYGRPGGCRIHCPIGYRMGVIWIQGGR